MSDAARDAVLAYSRRPSEEIGGPVEEAGILVFWPEQPLRDDGMPKRIGAGLYLYNPETGKVAHVPGLPQASAVRRFRHLVD